MALDMTALRQRGAAARLQEIAAEIAELQTFIVNGNHAAPPPDYLHALKAFNAGYLRAFKPSRPAGELEIEMEAHRRPRKTKRAPQTATAKAARRQRTADFLATFTKPVSIENLRRAGILKTARATIASLVRYKYLRQRGDIFRKTRKPFLVEPSSGV